MYCPRVLYSKNFFDGNVRVAMNLCALNTTRSSRVHVSPTDISQYRLRFGSSLLYKSVFYLNCLTAQLSCEGRAAVEGDK
jgi:hypothetical protein